MSQTRYLRDGKTVECRSRGSRSPEALAFLAEIEAVMQRHGIEIEHEDGHGVFVLRWAKDGGSSWVCDASEEVVL
jgi:hypothetical protein